jgi:hypothetical protein
MPSSDHTHWRYGRIKNYQMRINTFNFQFYIMQILCNSLFNWSKMSRYLPLRRSPRGTPPPVPPVRVYSQAERRYSSVLPLLLLTSLQYCGNRMHTSCPKWISRLSWRRRWMKRSATSPIESYSPARRINRDQTWYQLIVFIRCWIPFKCKVPRTLKLQKPECCISLSGASIAILVVRGP